MKNDFVLEHLMHEVVETLILFAPLFNLRLYSVSVEGYHTLTLF